MYNYNYINVLVSFSFLYYQFCTLFLPYSYDFSSSSLCVCLSDGILIDQQILLKVLPRLNEVSSSSLLLKSCYRLMRL